MGVLAKMWPLGVLALLVSTSTVLADGSPQEPTTTADHTREPAVSLMSPVTATSPAPSGQALALAGGFKDRAKQTHVVVFRRGPGGSQAVQIQEINAKRVMEGKQIVDDVRLEPGDLVFVSKSHIPNTAGFTNITNTMLSSL